MKFSPAWKNETKQHLYMVEIGNLQLYDRVTKKSSIIKCDGTDKTTKTMHRNKPRPKPQPESEKLQNQLSNVIMDW